VLEYANKRNAKAVARYLLGRQGWSPFDQEPVEFTALNFDFHPRRMAHELAAAGFNVETQRAVSFFRMPLMKRFLPARLLAGADGLLQVPGATLKPAPSVFLRCRRPGDAEMAPLVSRAAVDLFRCPQCGSRDWAESPAALRCQHCAAEWAIDGGIYDFKSPRHKD
jgi:hypothetical protein